MAAARREFIQKENAVVRQRHFAGHRDLPAPDQPRIGDRMAGGAKGAGRDERRAVAGEAGNTGVMRAGLA